MSVTQTQQFTKTWIVADSQTTVEGFLSLPDRIVAETAVGSLGNVTASLQGSPSGFQLQGEFSAVRMEYSNLADKSFSVATISAVLPNKGNAPLQITFNIAQRLMTVGVQKSDATTARVIFDAVLGLFPEALGISQAELAAKADRLAGLLSEANALKATAAELQSKTKTVAELTAQAKSAADSASASAADANKAKQDAMTQKAETLSARQEAQKTLGEITAVKTQVQGEQGTTQKLSQGVTAMEATIREFFVRVDEHVGKLKKAEKDTESLTLANSTLQGQIKEQLLKAVGAGLFGAFDRRKGQIVMSKWIWAGLSVAAVLVQVGVVVWLAAEAKQLGASADAAKLLSPLFLLKATAAIPVFFLIGFCVTQYSHERRYEETYAFRTALSFSLAPYLDLVRKMPDHKEAEEYRKFVIATVGQVFADPFLEMGKKKETSHKMLGDVEQLLDSIGKLAEKIRR